MDHPVARRSFLIVIGLRFYAWSVPGPGATTVNRYSSPAFREAAVWQERQTLKQLTSVRCDKCSGSESPEALRVAWTRGTCSSFLSGRSS